MVAAIIAQAAVLNPAAALGVARVWLPALSLAVHVGVAWFGLVNASWSRSVTLAAYNGLRHARDP